MTTHTNKHKEKDRELFGVMTTLLVSSATGDADYGLRSNDATEYRTTRYEDVASVLTTQGYTTRYGRAITADALKKLVGRMRKDTNAMKEFRPDFDSLSPEVFLTPELLVDENIRVRQKRIPGERVSRFSVMPGDNPASQPICSLGGLF
jgi:hypothetical protein